jgi:hypothetical protein
MVLGCRKHFDELAIAAQGSQILHVNLDFREKEPPSCLRHYPAVAGRAGSPSLKVLSATLTSASSSDRLRLTGLLDPKIQSQNEWPRCHCSKSASAEPVGRFCFPFGQGHIVGGDIQQPRKYRLAHGGALRR